MRDELRPYPEYKDSGLPWLGRIPAHWETKSAFACYAPKLMRNTGMQESKVLSLSFGRIVVKPPEKLHGLVPESFETYQIVEAGDIIIRATDLQNDHNSLRVGHVRERGIITSAYLCLCTKNMLTSVYGYHYLNVWDHTKAIYGYGSGLRQNLAFSHFKHMPVAMPPVDEQESIDRYLISTNRRINRFIRNRRRLIAVLNEQKHAIINRAVTRGLDPNVRFKPYGVEWLGESPEHWEERRLRNIVELRVSNVDKHSKDGEIPVRLCNYTDVYKNSVITTDMPFMAATATPEEIAAFHIRVGDVLITKDSEDWQDIGVPAVVVQTADDIVCGYHLAILRPKTDFISGHFLTYALQCRSAVTQLNLAAKGVTRFGLSQGAIKSLSLSVPSVDEQEKIVLFIEEATASLNGLIRRAQREIDLIREYRTRLITDVVTGKLDVRHLSPDLDEELAEPVDLDEDIDEEELLGEEEPDLDEEVTDADY
ncbi:MAG: restriction endonuclease subunit S [Pseudomonadota bacterium]